MSKNITNNRFLMGATIAPLVALFSLFLFAGLESAIHFSIGSETYNKPSSSILAVFGIIIGVPISYAIAILIGLPTIIVFRKLGIVKFWSFAAGGGLLGCIFGIVMCALPPFNEGASALVFAYIGLAGSIFGGFGLGSFWVIAIKESR